MTYSRIDVFAREYRLSRLRLQKACSDANSLWPKTVTTRNKAGLLVTQNTFGVDECMPTHSVSTSEYYILGRHYYLVRPVPSQGAPDPPWPAALRLPHSVRPPKAAAGRLRRVRSLSFVNNRATLWGRTTRPYVVPRAIRAIDERRVRLADYGWRCTYSRIAAFARE